MRGADVSIGCMLLIDARCLAGRFSGIQRFTTHVLRAVAECSPMKPDRFGGCRVLVRAEADLPTGLPDGLRDAGAALHSTGAGPSLLRDQLPSLPRRRGRWPLWIHAAQAAAEGGAPLMILSPDAFAPLRVPAAVRRIVTVHDVIPLVRRADLRRSWKGRLPGLWRAWLRRQAAAADRVLTVSSFSKADIVNALAVDPAKIAVVGNAVEPLPQGGALPPALVRGADALGLPFVLCVGRADPYKNQRGLVEAFARLLVLAKADSKTETKADFEADSTAEALPGLRLVFAGAADRRYPDAAERAAELGVADRVLWLQPTEAQLGAMYREAAAVAVPSLYEGFGLPAIEAMVAGTPVVCSDAASLPEVVGDAALRVDAADPHALAQALHRSITDAALRAELIAAGRRRAAHWSLKRFAGRLSAALDEASGAPPRRH